MNGSIDDAKTNMMGTNKKKLLDIKSTVDVFTNPTFLRNICPAESTLNIHCNAGVVEIHQVGDLVGYGEVWYYPEGISNILFLERVTGKGIYRVTYNSGSRTDFLLMNKKTDKICRFIR